MVVPQAFGLSTAEVYAEADRLGLPRSDKELDTARRQLEAALGPGRPLRSSLLVNDLAPAAMSLAPRVEDAVLAVRATGAEHALVCGSGPTVAGLWRGADALEQAERATAELAGRFPGTMAATPVPTAFGLPQTAGV
jgi:4-diphosphocytidyl-2-C-methyl-D-erythritol kinase